MHRGGYKGKSCLVIYPFLVYYKWLSYVVLLEDLESFNYDRFL